MPYKDPANAALRDKVYREERKIAASGVLGRPPKLPKFKPQLRLPVAAKIKVPVEGLRVATLMDVQAKPDVPIDHLGWYGKYVAEKQPDVIVCIGDFADMESLSSYDEGTGKMEGRRYRKDIDVAIKAMETFMNPIAKKAGYNPKLVMTLGNHEDRIDRAIAHDPVRNEGEISIRDLKYKDFGWEVIPFLQPVVIGGVSFCHYFPSGVMGKPITTARAILTKLHMSCVAGHQQGRDIAFGKRADGKDMTAIISGSFYQHHEGYLPKFINETHWRGTWFLHEVRDGQFDEMALSIKFLKRRYGSAK